MKSGRMPLKRQVMGQSLEHVDLMSGRSRGPIDAPIERQRRDNPRQRKQQSAQNARPERAISVWSPLPLGEG